MFFLSYGELSIVSHRALLLSDDTSENVSDLSRLLAKPVGSVGLEVARMTDLFLTSVTTFFEPAISCLEHIAYLSRCVPKAVANKRLLASSVCLHVWNKSAATGRIFVRTDIGLFTKICRQFSIFG
jgi:hypothetical protein